MRVASPPGAWLGQAVAAEQVADGAGGGQGQFGLAACRTARIFLGPQVGWCAAGVERAGPARPGAVTWGPARVGAAVVAQGLEAALLVAGEPLVAGLGADGEAVGRVRSWCRVPRACRATKLGALVHRVESLSRAWGTSWEVMPILW